MESEKTKEKSLFIKIFVSVLLILLGNLFWYVLIQNLSGSHILTNSALQIALTLLVPIVVFSLYLSCCAIFSIFLKTRLIWFVVLLLSMADYFILTGSGYLDLVGELIITVALFLFLVNFHKYDVFVSGKPSLNSRISQAFSTSSILISLTLAFNFYSIYSHTLSSNNQFISNRILARILTPIVSIYNDDLQITNPNEKFMDYQARMSKQENITPLQVRQNTLAKLKISSGDDSALMKDLIKASLDNSVLVLARDYGKILPILISLGLGIIVQTLISISSTVSNYLTTLLLLALRKLGVTKVTTSSFTAVRDIWID